MNKDLQQAYKVLNGIPKNTRKDFILNAILFYQDYLETCEEDVFYIKADVKEALYDLIRDGEISPEFIKQAAYDIKNADKRQEEINWYLEHLK